ncbi:MAG: hypothetical protein Q8916_05315 [Bacteroidota bacterium]|nr:hypothetical protein [Bacteroidota bacterium]MDP4229808.1 hypothetical protein [Bacteroidota bacterium]MDP4236929.1 hypothetical protein [Bacteroidota bacterium]
MKRILSSLFLMVLLSCGQSHAPLANHVVVRMRDNSTKDYFLLAIHDSSLIVAPFVKGESIDLGSLVGSAESIPFSSIRVVTHSEKASGDDEFIGGFIGCFTGGTIGGCAAAQSAFGENSVPPTLPVAVLYIASPFIGIGVGVLIADLMAAGNEEYFLDTKPQIENLRHFAYYSKQEPPQLKILK